MRMSLRLPGGTLKIKTYAYLRSYEREKKVPVYQVGDIYFIWLPAGENLHP